MAVVLAVGLMPLPAFGDDGSLRGVSFNGNLVAASESTTTTVDADGNVTSTTTRTAVDSDGNVEAVTIGGEEVAALDAAASARGSLLIAGATGGKGTIADLQGHGSTDGGLSTSAIIEAGKAQAEADEAEAEAAAEEAARAAFDEEDAAIDVSGLDDATFATQRIVVALEEGAQLQERDLNNVASEGAGMYVLEYKNADAAKRAYVRYANYDGTAFVAPDSRVEASADGDGDGDGDEDDDGDEDADDAADAAAAVEDTDAAGSADADATEAADDAPVADLGSLEGGQEALGEDAGRRESEDATKPAGERAPVVALIDTAVPADAVDRWNEEHGASAELVGRVSAIGGEQPGDAAEDSHGARMLEQILAADPDARVLSVEALDGTGYGSAATVYAALSLATAAKADVYSMSFAGYAVAGNDAIEAGVEELREAAEGDGRPVALIAAAGNQGQDVRFFAPASYEGVAAVGALDASKAPYDPADLPASRLASSNHGEGLLWASAESTSFAAAKASGALSAMGAEALSGDWAEALQAALVAGGAAGGEDARPAGDADGEDGGGRDGESGGDGAASEEDTRPAGDAAGDADGADPGKGDEAGGQEGGGAVAGVAGAVRDVLDAADGGGAGIPAEATLLGGLRDRVVQEGFEAGVWAAAADYTVGPGSSASASVSGKSGASAAAASVKLVKSGYYELSAKGGSGAVGGDVTAGSTGRAKGNAGAGGSASGIALLSAGTGAADVYLVAGGSASGPTGGYNGGGNGGDARAAAGSTAIGYGGGGGGASHVATASGTLASLRAGSNGSILLVAGGGGGGGVGYSSAGSNATWGASYGGGGGGEPAAGAGADAPGELGNWTGTTAGGHGGTVSAVGSRASGNNDTTKANTSGEGARSWPGDNGAAGAGAAGHYNVYGTDRGGQGGGGGGGYNGGGSGITWCGAGSYGLGAGAGGGSAYWVAGMIGAAGSQGASNVTASSAGSASIAFKGIQLNFDSTCDGAAADTRGTATIYVDGSNRTYSSNAFKTTAAIAVPAKALYRFNGYYSERNGKGTQYVTAAGALVNGPVAALANGATLYASWTYVGEASASGKAGQTGSATPVKLGRSGYYRLSVTGGSGAAGGMPTAGSAGKRAAGAAGAGGTATGVALLSKSDKAADLYLVAGGQASGPTGGYNGGANGGDARSALGETVGYGGGGGGASHIATASGTLASLRAAGGSSVLIAAGGGGGGGSGFTTLNTFGGGAGGGGGGSPAAGAGADGEKNVIVDKSGVYQGKGGTVSAAGGSGSGNGDTPAADTTDASARSWAGQAGSAGAGGAGHYNYTNTSRGGASGGGGGGYNGGGSGVTWTGMSDYGFGYGAGGGSAYWAASVLNPGGSQGASKTASLSAGSASVAFLGVSYVLDSAGSKSNLYLGKDGSSIYTDSSFATKGAFPVPTNGSYRFGGFFTGRDGQGTQYVSAAGALVNDPYGSLEQGATLYAYWIGVAYHRADGSVGTYAPLSRESAVYSEADVLALAGAGAATEAPAGSVFVGWATSALRARAGAVDYRAASIAALSEPADLYPVYSPGASSITADAPSPSAARDDSGATSRAAPAWGFAAPRPAVRVQAGCKARARRRAAPRAQDPGLRVGTRGPAPPGRPAPHAQPAILRMARFRPPRPPSAERGRG